VHNQHYFAHIVLSPCTSGSTVHCDCWCMFELFSITVPLWYFFAMVHRHMLNGDEFVLLFQATELKREWFSCLGNVFIAAPYCSIA